MNIPICMHVILYHHFFQNKLATPNAVVNENKIDITLLIDRCPIPLNICPQMVAPVICAPNINNIPPIAARAGPISFGR